jgi:hypothetical protein
MNSSRITNVITCLAIAAGVGVTACSQAAPAPANPSTSAGAQAVTPSVSVARTGVGAVDVADTTAGSADDSLPDGSHAARITRVDPEGQQVTIDVVQFFVGDAATEAARLDGAPEVPPPNDYWIRNTNPKLRSLSVVTDAPVVVNTLSAAETGTTARDDSISLSQLASYGNDRVSGALFWITTREDTVTEIAEQYLP